MDVRYRFDLRSLLRVEAQASSASSKKLQKVLLSTADLTEGYAKALHHVCRLTSHEARELGEALISLADMVERAHTPGPAKQPKVTQFASKAPLPEMPVFQMNGGLAGLTTPRAKPS